MCPYYVYEQGNVLCFSEDGNLLCFIKSGNVLCFRAASMHELKEMAAEVTSMTAEPSRVTELTSDVTSDATSHYTSDVTSEFVSEVNSEVPASDVTSALAATEAPA